MAKRIRSQLSVRWGMVIAALAALPIVQACDDEEEAVGPELGQITCAATDPVCPPASLTAGFNGQAGTPTITPSNPSTSITTAITALSVSGTTNATANGYWLLVTASTLRAFGVLAVSSGSYAADIPLFCGAQAVILTFSNSTGRSYFLVNVTLTGCTTAAFRVQLSWDTDFSDMDLHLLRPGGAFGSSNDCYYANCTGTGLEWGASGTAGNPLLDVDDVDGFGPENITIASGAEAGEYRVIVHNFDSSPSTRPTVRVYFNDVEAARIVSAQTLDSPSRIYWEVARVNVQGSTVTQVNVYSSTPPTGAVAGVAAGK